MITMRNPLKNPVMIIRGALLAAVLITVVPPLAGCANNPFVKAEDTTAREVWNADQKWLTAQGKALSAASDRIDPVLFHVAVTKYAEAQAKLDARKATLDKGEPDAFLSPRQSAEREWDAAKGAFVVASKRATTPPPADPGPQTPDPVDPSSLPPKPGG